MGLGRAPKETHYPIINKIKIYIIFKIYGIQENITHLTLILKNLIAKVMILDQETKKYNHDVLFVTFKIN